MTTLNERKKALEDSFFEVGNEKREFIHLVFGEADLNAMKQLRAAFDPDLVCNPEKIFPTTRFCAEANPRARGYDAVLQAGEDGS